MSASKAIYNILSNDAGVTALVSASSIHPVIAKQNQAAPYVVFNEIATNPSNTKTGPSKLDQVRVQIDTYSATHTTGANIEAAIRTALDRKKGAFGGVTVDGIQYITTSSDYEEETNLHRKISEYYLRIVKA